MSDSTTETTNGRDEGGRFAPGNRGGPGRPRRETERAYLDATVAAVPVERWAAVVAKALDDAEAGDAKARDWLSKVLGIEAPHKLAYTDPDGDPFNFSELLATVRRAAPAPETGRPSNMLDMDEAIKRALEAD